MPSIREQIRVEQEHIWSEIQTRRWQEAVSRSSEDRVRLGVEIAILNGQTEVLSRVLALAQD